MPLKVFFPKLIKTFFAPFIATSLIIILSIAYSTYFVDNSLENLKITVEHTAEAQTLGQIREIGVLLAENLMREISLLRLDSTRVANIEYMTSVIATGSSDRKRDDIKEFLEAELSARGAARGKILSFLDNTSERIAGWIDYLQTLPSRKIPRETTPKEGIGLLEGAETLEADRQFEEALKLYQKFIESYPQSINLYTVKLHMGNCYRKLARYDEAVQIYQEITKRAYGTVEARIAKQLLADLRESKALIKEKDRILVKIPEIKFIGEQQGVYYRLGNIFMELGDYNEANKAFQKVIEIDPNTALGVKAKFNLGWSYKTIGRFEEAIIQFEELAEAQVNTEMATNSEYQIADIYLLQKDYEKATAKYETIAEKYSEFSISEVALKQLVDTYRFDLKQEGRAFEVAKKLEEKKVKRPELKKVEKVEEALGIFDSIQGLAETATDAWKEEMFDTGRYLMQGHTKTFNVATDEVRFNDFFSRSIKPLLPKEVDKVYIDFLHNDKMSPIAKIKIGKIDVRVSAIGSVELVADKIVVYDVTVYIGQFPIPKTLTEPLLKSFNEGLAELSYSMDLKEFKVTDTEWHIKGINKLYGKSPEELQFEQQLHRRRRPGEF